MREREHFLRVAALQHALQIYCDYCMQIFLPVFILTFLKKGGKSLLVSFQRKNGQNIVSYNRVFIVEESKLPNRITRTTADDADKHFKKLLNWRNKTNNGQIASIFLCELGVYFFKEKEIYSYKLSTCYCDHGMA